MNAGYSFRKYKMKIVIALIFVTTFIGSSIAWCADPGIYQDGSRRPETDTDIDLCIHNWKDSQVHIGHGGFVE